MSPGRRHTIWVTLPLKVPSPAGLGVLLFLCGGRLLIALTMIGGAHPDALPATVKLGSFALPPGGPAIASAAILHSTVAVVPFLLLQRYFAGSLVISA